MSEGGQADGCYPRVNGGMIQSNQYTGSIVSLVGKVTGPETLTTADGTKVTINTEYIEGGLLVNPDLVIELIGQVQDPTVVNVSFILICICVLLAVLCVRSGIQKNDTDIYKQTK